jgi:hypothetical protein
MDIMYLNAYGIEIDAIKAKKLFKFAIEKREQDAEHAIELSANKRLQQQHRQDSSLDSPFSGAEGSEE